LATATTRAIRTGTREAAQLDTADDAFWDAAPVGQRMMLALRLSVKQWRLHGASRSASAVVAALIQLSQRGDFEN
jgi:hypothetical protein